MAVNLKPIGDNEIEEILNKLTKEYGMSLECLSHLLGVKIDGEKLNISQGVTAVDRNSYKSKSINLNLLLMLDDILENEPDLRFKAFLEVLITVHKISAHTIAKFAKIPTHYVLDFMIDSSTVPIEIKYKLASAIMVLRHIFKTVEPKISKMSY